MPMRFWSQIQKVLPMKIKKIYKVVIFNRDSGRETVQYYSNRKSAESIPDGAVTEVSAYYIKGEYYLNPIKVHDLTRKEALAQIPDNIKKVLGL